MVLTKVHGAVMEGGCADVAAGRAAHIQMLWLGHGVSSPYSEP